MVSSTVWWVLAASVLVGLIIMVIAAVWTWRRIRKIRIQYTTSMPQGEKDSIARAFARETHGMILEDLKPKGLPYASDLQLELALNSFVRNQYKTVYFHNFESDYERKSFEQLVQAEVVGPDQNCDLALVYCTPTTYLEIKSLYKNLNDKGMIIIFNAEKRSRETKDIRNELKILEYRHEWQDIDKGMILVAR